MASAKSSLSLARIPIAAKIGVVVRSSSSPPSPTSSFSTGDVSSAIRSARSQETSLRGRLAEARKAEYAYHPGPR